jgi:DHA1 family multidrug resistance protein-like MFS transporter
MAMMGHPGAKVRVFSALFFATATAMLGLGIIAPILPLYAKTFAASGVEIGLVFTAFSISRALLGPFVGRLSDHVGRKSLMLAGLGIYAVISVLYVLADSLWELGLFRFLQGIGSVMVGPLAQAYVGDMTPRGKEGRYMNAFYASQFLGIGIGPLLGGFIGAAWSYEAAFLVMGGLSLLSVLLVAITVPVDRATKERKLKRRREIVPLRTILANDAVKAMSIYVGTRGFWRQSFNTFFPLFAVASLAVDESRIGLVLSSNMLAEGLLQIPFGFLSDRYPRVRQIVVGSIFAPFMILAVPFMPSIWSVAALASVMGAFSALGRASLVAIRTEIGRTHGMATLGGLQGSSFAVGQMLGPLASGFIVDAFGLVAVFPFASAVGFIGTGLVLVYVRRWLKRDPDAPLMARLESGRSARK